MKRFWFSLAATITVVFLALISGHYAARTGTLSPSGKSNHAVAATASSEDAQMCPTGTMMLVAGCPKGKEKCGERACYDPKTQCCCPDWRNKKNRADVFTKSRKGNCDAVCDPIPKRPK